MKIISISGLDGSGKSTQIELLKRYLESQNKRVFYFHAIQFGIANKLLRKNNESQKSVARANWLTVKLRKIFLFIDIARFKKLAKKLEKEGYDYILSDRYFYDSVVNIHFLEDNSQFSISIPPSDIAIYLDADPKIIVQREIKPDQGIDYLQKKYELYKETIQKWNLKIINANQSKEEIFGNIRELLHL